MINERRIKLSWYDLWAFIQLILLITFVIVVILCDFKDHGQEERNTWNQTILALSVELYACTTWYIDGHCKRGIFSFEGNLMLFEIFQLTTISHPIKWLNKCYIIVMTDITRNAMWRWRYCHEILWITFSFGKHCYVNVT